MDKHKNSQIEPVEYKQIILKMSRKRVNIHFMPTVFQMLSEN